MNRRASNQRCENAWNYRCEGRTWPEVAREFGYGSAQNARKAVHKWLQKNPNDDLEIMRRASGQMLVTTTRKLVKALDIALESEKTRDAAELGKAIFDGVEKYAKLTGQHVVVPTEVNVTVTQTMSELVTDARAKLMQAIDAEVLDVQEVPRVQLEA